jgi:DNA processing protein
MSDSDFNKLRLIRSPNIGPVTYRQMISRFGSAGAALDALPNLARSGGNARFTVAPADQINREIDATLSNSAKFLFMDDAEYPVLLGQLDNGPVALSVKGNLGFFKKPMVAIVGARNASAAACRFARQLANDLGQAGLVVVSGLARGIDTAAHHGSLPHSTIGVIAGGIDVVYPPENRDLQNAIAQQGLLIAEQPVGTEPRARHFPHRNRIIAGLALGTVVIEAAPRSGSLITARLAAEAGREVMAVPGSPLDPRAQGCNQLIREGAVLVQNAQDVAELIAPIDMRARSWAQPNISVAPVTDADDADRRHVVSLLGLTGVPVDELIRQSQLPATVVQYVLLELELAGRLERGAGGKVRLQARN